MPDIFIIGTMKGGTTSLEELLSKHDQICFGEFQEKHYFDGQMKKPDYINSFGSCKGSQLTLDKTPSYIRTPSAPKKIKESYSPEELAKKRFILILRDPVARMYSEYGMAIRYCEGLFYHDHHTEEERSMIKAKHLNASKHTKQANGRLEKDAIRFKMCNKVTTKSIQRINAMNNVKFISFKQWLESAKHISAGQYLSEIQNWTKVLPRSQLLILQFNTLITNTTDTSNSISKFLNLKSNFGDYVSLPRANTNDQTNTTVVIPPMTCQSVEKLQKLYAKQYSELHSYINMARDKPHVEPFWQPFDKNETLNKCV